MSLPLTGRQRIGAMLSGQPVDRVPFVPVLSLYGSRLSPHDSTAYYTDPEAYVAGQRAVVDLLEPDVVFAPFALAVEGAAFGGQEHFLPRHAPNMAAFGVKGPGDLSQMRPPDPRTHPRLGYVRDSVARLREQLGERAMVCGICLAPVDSPALIMGMDAWLQVFLFDEPAAAEVLKVTTAFFVAWANTLLAAGADFICLPVAFANPSVVTRELAEERVLPVLRESFADVNGPIVFHHTGGPLGPFLSMYRELPNVIGFVMDSRDDLRAARAIVGPGKLLLGNLNGPMLASTTAEATWTLADGILADRQGDGLFLLGTSGADVPWHTPPANLLAIRDAIARAGSQPGPGDSPTLLACSIFRSFIDGMDWEGPPPGRVYYLDSALHLVPGELQSIIDSVLDHERRAGRKVLVAFGDCGDHLVEQCRESGRSRLPIVNCCEALVGKERFRELRRGEVFAFLPEWSGRWRPLLSQALASDENTLRGIFRDTNQAIVFVESGEARTPMDVKREITAFFALPASTETVTGDYLRASLRADLRALHGGIA